MTLTTISIIVLLGLVWIKKNYKSVAFWGTNIYALVPLLIQSKQLKPWLNPLFMIWFCMVLIHLIYETFKQVRVDEAINDSKF